jgi:hypothetical protein
LSLFSRRGSLKGVLQLGARVPVIEQLRSILQHHLLKNRGHGVQVLKCIERKPVVTGGHEAFRATTILGWACATTVGAEGIGLSRLRLQTVLDADLMAPGNVQVIFVDEAGAFAEAQRGQRHVRRRCRHFPRPVARCS